jgi:hypothetical protein
MKLNETSLPVLHIPEPPLEFSYGQKSPYPKDGLFLYGPHLKSQKTPHISIGAIGSAEGVGHFKSWAAKLKGRIEVPAPKRGEKKDRLHLANFPGIEEAFGISFDPEQVVSYEIDPKELDEATRNLNLHESVRKAVEVFLAKVKYHDRNEERRIDVWVLILPELVFERCKPKAKRVGLSLIKGDFGKKQKERSDLPLLGAVIDQTPEEIFDDIPDFHRQAKAAFLQLNHTSQLIRETTLAPEAFLNKAGYPMRRLQDPATVGWNLATGLYYKTQPDPPWKLASARPGVAYIGLVYKLLPNDPNEFACCAAQMFLAEGDGVVFRGANGPWKTGRHEFHLKPPAAKQLIGQVLDTYRDKQGGRRRNCSYMAARRSTMKSGRRSRAPCQKRPLLSGYGSRQHLVKRNCSGTGTIRYYAERPLSSTSKTHISGQRVIYRNSTPTSDRKHRTRFSYPCCVPAMRCHRLKTCSMTLWD